MDRRIHFLDQVRSHMMLLGIVLHAAGSYNNFPAGELWPYKSVDVHVLYSVIINVIHSFRMQVFFLVAGLFAAMLISKRGNTGFLKNRTQRVLLPLLVFAGPIIIYCNHLYSHGAELMALRGIDVEFDHSIRLYHLWFLYYLYFYVLAAIPLQWLLNRFFTAEQYAKNAKMLPWALGLVLALVHVINGSYMLEAPVGLDILNPAFVQYALFFGTGMVAYHMREAFFNSIAHWGRLLLFTILSLIVFVIIVSITAARNPEDPQAFVWYGALFLGLYYALVCWFILAVYKRLCDHFSARARYLSEASYWVYLVHLPITVAVPMWIDHWSVHHSLKFGLVLLITFAISLITYQVFVRSTGIGWLLNGKKRRFYFPFIHRAVKYRESEQAG
ncbi:MAG: hypothetical protein CMK83_25115 [Pseudomonadales bacterium]|uniref:acyltransferase family protein n=1 Tax=unclassified Ketobacter TaxID=2639109 RepID=UPI000C49813E|nr:MULTISPECIES: acyltransferase family protein [unclassified Ketobacter]MAQ27501.1 hypothetical protein [Pseudomonadales bacterium]HAG94371.1 hypothetical protein [Gammaproteobacteria bacterium]MBI26663.1 hypothetical protein [Pseudomonadales bacterium]RLT88780.1 MAG: hypothetical protein D9N13_16570 [Ketobacter sp. GenoA1]RLT97619.1 MAG: hypothetical protein D9N15_07370 [Ketobacter sp.]